MHKVMHKLCAHPSGQPFQYGVYIYGNMQNLLSHYFCIFLTIFWEVKIGSHYFCLQWVGKSEVVQSYLSSLQQNWPHLQIQL